MDQHLFVGELVRLTGYQPETDADLFARSSLDSEYWNIANSSFSHPMTARKVKEEIEKEEVNPLEFDFAIRTLTDNVMIGGIELENIEWTHGEAWVGIGICDRNYWGKGYGTDAMDIMLRFAFKELNLHRMSLSVFDINLRAIRSYEKSGFTREGIERKYLLKGGERMDILYMGILAEEWERKTAAL